MDTHIILLFGALVLGVISGAVAIASALGLLYLAPLIAVGFFLAVTWKVAEMETLGRRLRLFLLIFACLVLVSVGSFYFRAAAG